MKIKILEQIMAAGGHRVGWSSFAGATEQDLEFLAAKVEVLYTDIRNPLIALPYSVIQSRMIEMREMQLELQALGGEP